MAHPDARRDRSRPDAFADLSATRLIRRSGRSSGRRPGVRRRLRDRDAGRGELLGLRWRHVHLADPSGPTLRVEETFVAHAVDTPKSVASEQDDLPRAGRRPRRSRPIRRRRSAGMTPERVCSIRRRAARSTGSDTPTRSGRPSTSRVSKGAYASSTTAVTPRSRTPPQQGCRPPPFRPGRGVRHVDHPALHRPRGRRFRGEAELAEARLFGEPLLDLSRSQVRHAAD